MQKHNEVKFLELEKIAENWNFLWVIAQTIGRHVARGVIH